MRSLVEKKESKFTKQLTVGIILIAIMVLSVLGYSLQSQEKTSDTSNKINYNGFEFQKQNDYWILNFQNQNLAFFYNPEETTGINANVNAISSYNNKPLYIYSDNKEAEAEIYRNIYPFVLRVQYACIEGEKCMDNSPIKTCKDNFIIIQETNQSKITQTENCVFISGQNEELIKAGDAFLFKTLGIA